MAVKRGAIVLGAKVNADGSPSVALLRRLARAQALWNEQEIDCLLLSGGRPEGHPYDGTEADVMAASLEKAGIPAQALVRETESQTTRENALYSLRMAVDLGMSDIVVVTDRAHLPRAMMVFGIIRYRYRYCVSLSGVGAALPWSWASAKAYGREAVAVALDAVRAWRILA